MKLQIIRISIHVVNNDSDITDNFQVSEETHNLSNSQNAGSEIFSVNSDQNLSDSEYSLKNHAWDQACYRFFMTNFDFF